MKKKIKKICFIAPKFLRAIGGVESHGYEFTKEFQKDNNFNIVSIISKKKVQDGVSLLKRSGDDSMEKITKRILTSNMKTDLNLILKNSPRDTDIYFFNNPNWLPIAQSIKKERPNSKIIVRSGGNDLVAGWIGNENDLSTKIISNRRKLVKIINSYVDKLIINSDYSMQRMLDIGISKKKMIKIQGGVDCKRFRPIKNKKNKDKITIGVISRLVEFKGIEYSLKCIKELKRLSNKKIKYIIVGDGPSKKELKRLSKSLGISDIVEFIEAEKYEKIDKYFRKLDIFLHLPIYLLKKERGSSYIHTETMGRCLCEASSSGIPTVTSNVGGVPEIIKNNKSGFVVKEKDYKSASKQVLRLIEDDKLRLKMAEKSRKISLKKFDGNIIFNKYRKLF